MNDEKTNPFLEALLAEVARYKTDLDIDLTNISSENAPNLQSAFINVMDQFDPSQHQKVVNTGLDWADEQSIWSKNILTDNLLGGLIDAKKISEEDMVYEDKKNFWGKVVKEMQKIPTLTNYLQTQLPGILDANPEGISRAIHALDEEKFGPQ
tara:strand:+ start:233 stop:691 length:459 start_codon:yes stop_codon:yes gene_type:complete